MANRAQTYAMAKATLRDVAKNERKEQKRERKRKLEALRRYRRTYMQLLNAAMLGKKLVCHFRYSGELMAVYANGIAIHGAKEYPWANGIERDAQEVRLFIRGEFERIDGLKPWQLDAMEKP